MEKVIQEGVKFATNFHADFIRQPVFPQPPQATAVAATAKDDDEEIGVVSVQKDDYDTSKSNFNGNNKRKRKLSMMEPEKTTTANEEEEFSAEKMIEEFEGLTKDAERIQKEVLKKILEENWDTEYLRTFGVKSDTSEVVFKSAVPLVSYESIRPFVDRVVDGDSNPILTERPIRVLSLSSGTSEGQPKKVPFTEEMINDYVQSMLTSYAYRSRKYPIDETKKSLQFLYIGKTSETKSGITTGLVSTHVMMHPKFKSALKAERCSPDEILNSSEPDQALYCHLLCGLIYREEVQYVFAVFGHALIVAFRSFEQTWEQLVDDIRSGVLSSRITVPALREAMSKVLVKADPKLADEIEEICKGMSAEWHGLIPKLFPDVKYVNTIVTGSAAHYVGKLKTYAGEIPIVGNDYGSSEGWVATNINPDVPPESITFTPMPNIAYYEFIPLNNLAYDHDDAKTVGLTDVKVGEEYELVFTNFQGMYRYKLGDRVKVTGFHNATPQLRYICRSNILLSINIDKITEKDLRIAIEAGTKELSRDGRMELVDFTSYAEKTLGTEHYIIYWELNAGEEVGNYGEVLKQCCTSMDLGFPELGYVNSRKSRGLGPLELRVVERGTFVKVFEYFVGGGITAAQFKIPRAVTNRNVLRILDDHVIKKYISAAYP